MYLLVGNNRIIRKNKIIGIFDMDNASISEQSKRFFKNAEKNGLIESATEDLPKSFILFEDEKDKGKTKICFSHISSQSLCNRIRKNERNRLF